MNIGHAIDAIIGSPSSCVRREAIVSFYDILQSKSLDKLTRPRQEGATT